MAVRAENGSGQEPLGSLLVARGLITQEQLTEALARQQSTGEPLGATVVALGFASPATVAQALATQHGGLLKTEYGFATGFGVASSAPVVVGEPPVSQPRVGRAAAQQAVREELSHASAEADRLNDANERLAAARSELEQRLAAESQRAGALEADVQRWQEAVENWQTAYGELEQRLGERDAELEELRASVEACGNVRTELEQGLAAEVERSQALKRELAELESRRSSAESAGFESAAYEQQLAEVTARAEALEAEVAEARQLGTSASEGARAELEAKLVQAAEQLQAAESVRAELEQRLAHATEEAAGLGARVAETDGLRRSALASEQRIGELERQLEAARAELESRSSELETRNAELEELQAAPSIPVSPWADANRHLLFFQGAQGYELVERDGPPPAEGARVDEHTVTRIARSPIPGDDLPCAYLVLN